MYILQHLEKKFPSYPLDRNKSGSVEMVQQSHSVSELFPNIPTSREVVAGDGSSLFISILVFFKEL